jgi:PEP-utilising enzyme, PEP-binding domain
LTTNDLPSEPTKDELPRQIAETGRQAAEEHRDVAEEMRQTSEAIRPAAEEARQVAEHLLELEEADRHIEVIRAARSRGRKIGVCGQAPSDYPQFARFLVERWIDRISPNPDAVLRTTLGVLERETAAAGARRRARQNPLTGRG